MCRDVIKLITMTYAPTEINILSLYSTNDYLLLKYNMLKLLIGIRSHGTQMSTVRCKIMHLNLGQGKGN